MEKYNFLDVVQKIYEFVWYILADVYLEKNKERFQSGDVQALVVL